jgi:hypothetical protein
VCVCGGGVVLYFLVFGSLFQHTAAQEGTIFEQEQDSFCRSPSIRKYYLNLWFTSNVSAAMC